MTFRERYSQEVRKGRMSPGAAFIREMMEVTKKCESAVRKWVAEENPIYPDALTQKVLADHFGTTEEELFPIRKTGKEG